MVEVYLLPYEEPFDRKDFSFFYKYIDERRRKKADKFKCQADKERCVLAGALLKHVLTRYKAVEDIFIQTDENGKPYVEGGPEFSLSHAGRWIGLAVSDKPVGLDIEGGRMFSDRVVSKFASKEQVWYEALSEEEKETGFYRLWTAKEAYGKRDGRGLGVGFSTFSVLDEKIEKDLYFQKIEEKYFLSICTEDCWDGRPNFLTVSDIKNFFST